MKNRFFALASIAVMFLNVVGFAAGDNQRERAKKREVTRLVSLLPASDCIAVFDSKRFFVEALPKILASNQPMLTDIMSKITEMEKTTGIDLRKFGEVAVGISYKQISAKETDYEPVAVANGDINAGALVAVAKLAADRTYRQEKIGDRTVYVFSPKDILQRKTGTVTNSKLAGVIDKALRGLTKEVAVTTLDDNTLVLGPLSRVRETIEAKTRVKTELSSMLSVKETTIMSFAGRNHDGLSQMIPLDDDDFGANIKLIDYLAGSIDVAASGTTFQVMARTKKVDDAQSLSDTLTGLKVVGEAILGASKRSDQKIYGRLIKTAKIERRANDLFVELLITHADINLLLAGLK